MFYNTEISNNTYFLLKKRQIRRLMSGIFGNNNVEMIKEQHHCGVFDNYQEIFPQ